MSLYEKMKAASDNRDVEAWLDCIHDDFVFVRHQTGAEMSKEEWTPMVTAMMQSDQLEIKNQRCIYENEEILSDTLNDEFSRRHIRGSYGSKQIKRW